MCARRRRVAAVTAATILLLGACGADDAGDQLATVPTSATDVLATTANSATTATSATTAITPGASTNATTVAPTSASPASTTASTAAPTTAPRTTAPPTTAGGLVLSWTSSGPPARACFEPGESVPDLVVDRAPDSEPFNFQVDIIDWQFEPFAVAPLSWTADYSDDRIVFTFTVNDAPRPWSVDLVLGYSVQGTQVFVTDEPEVFQWSFEDACD